MYCCCHLNTCSTVPHKDLLINVSVELENKSIYIKNVFIENKQITQVL